jgi:hypothetical protein
VLPGAAAGTAVGGRGAVLVTRLVRQFVVLCVFDCGNELLDRVDLGLAGCDVQARLVHGSHPNIKQA